MKMKGYYSARNREHYLIFRPRVRCERGWSALVTIRRRRFGPDAQVARRRFSGRGTRTLTLAIRCKNGNRFNGDVWLDISGGPTLHAVKKNVEC